MIFWRKLSLCLVLGIAAAHCAAGRGQDEAVTLPEADQSDAAAPTPLPSAPAVLELSTSRPNLVRLGEVESTAVMGIVHVSTPVPGVMVSIDGGPLSPLPLAREVLRGLHTVIAGCPGTPPERRTVTVEPGATVRITVCEPRR